MLYIKHKDEGCGIICHRAHAIKPIRSAKNGTKPEPVLGYNTTSGNSSAKLNSTKKLQKGSEKTWQSAHRYIRTLPITKYYELAKKEYPKYSNDVTFMSNAVGEQVGVDLFNYLTNQLYVDTFAADESMEYFRDIFFKACKNINYIGGDDTNLKNLLIALLS